MNRNPAEKAKTRESQAKVRRKLGERYEHLSETRRLQVILQTPRRGMQVYFANCSITQKVFLIGNLHFRHAAAADHFSVLDGVQMNIEAPQQVQVLHHFKHILRQRCAIVHGMTQGQ